jgi:uncharacterized membrane protein
MTVERKRHIAKALSYRVISTLIGFIVILIATGSVELSAMFSIAELFWKPVQYYVHERIWYRWINYGLKK